MMSKYVQAQAILLNSPYQKISIFSNDVFVKIVMMMSFFRSSHAEKADSAVESRAQLRWRACPSLRKAEQYQVVESAFDLLVVSFS
jgi:hypothetical protein